MSAARPRRPASALLPHLLIGLALLAGALALARLPAARMGDGSEYYAMYCAWDAATRPWLGEAGRLAYQRLLDSGQVAGLVPLDWFRHSFPALQLGAGADFNHFWFYSLLAVLCAKAAALFGLALAPHAAFLVLHALLLWLTLSLAWRLHGGAGLLAAALMTLCSPVLWFVDKVHTELMTVCLVLSAVMLLRARHCLAAALLLALAATQNPSFALIALLPLGHRAIAGRARPYRPAEVALVVATVLALALHPAYYLMRYGVPTPQLLAGGAALGGNLSTFYIWLLDPDLGLLPNWPLGLAALLLAVPARRWPGAAAPAGPLWRAFPAWALLVNAYAHSSTSNLNSGATPGLARYALWYLPLAFPLLLWLLRRCPWPSRRALLLAPLLLAVSAWSVWRYQPLGAEHYTEPSDFSRFVQQHLAQLYDPPAEVFYERYADGGESTTYLAVLGPDCRKVLLVPGNGRRGSFLPGHCQYDRERFEQFITGPLAASYPHRYVRLSAPQAAALHLRLTPQRYGLGAAAAGGFILREGWSGREDWGVWSTAAEAALSLPCDPAQFYAGGAGFALELALRPFGRQRISVLAGERLLWQGLLDQVDGRASLRVPAANCSGGQSRLTVRVSNPRAPAQRDGGADQRALGVALLSFQLAGPLP